MIESLFLGLGNSLPRMKLCDRRRYRLFQAAGMTFAGRCVIFAPITVRPIGGAGNISVGRNTFINSDVRFGAGGTISIGDHCQIASRVSFETVEHGLHFDISRNSRGTSHRPLRVANKVWIGTAVTVLPGVSIGEGAVVAAGAVVTSDVLPFTVVGGVPAKLIKTLETSAATDPQ
jgi:maltose O-acetyltransferase